jgi:type II secretory pathway component PulJ
MRTPRHNRRQPFTVVELVVAVAVLLIMMGILVRFVTQAQFAWNQSRTNVRMYEGARLFFDVIGRDLQSMVTSNDPGQTINYSVDNGELPTDWFLAFVTASGIGSRTIDPAKTMEVGYSFANNEITRTMTRSGVINVGTGSFGNNGAGYFSDWDFLNASAGTWTNPGTNAESSVVISGVRSVSVQAWSDSLTVVDDAADDTTKAPIRVSVTLSFFDPKMEPLPESKQNKSLRTITKTIFINRGG